jgi:hypothetical protein
MRIWRCHKKGAVDASGVLLLLCERIGNQEQLVVEQIAAVDETTLGAEIEIGIKDQEVTWPVAEQSNALANEKYFKAVTMRLKSYERPYCRFSGATENDVCHFWGYGVIVMAGESYLKPEHHTGR